MTVKCMDEDIFKDDLIGETRVAASHFTANFAEKLEWVHLYYNEQKAGEILVVSKFNENSKYSRNKRV